MKVCIHCDKPVQARGLCAKHLDRFYRHGDPLKTIRRAKGTGTKRRRGDFAIGVDGRRVFVHVLIAEKALGKALPPNACVHHADGNPGNNAPSNLVICPDQAYHSLLHRRMRAKKACGHADWRCCKICKQWAPPESLAIYGYDAMHRECNTRRSVAAKQRKRMMRAAP